MVETLFASEAEESSDVCRWASRDNLAVPSVESERLALAVAGLAEETVREDVGFEEWVVEVIRTGLSGTALHNACSFIIIEGAARFIDGRGSETGFFFFEVDASGGESVGEVCGVCRL